MSDYKDAVDARSTGRKRARQVVYDLLIRDDKPYACWECGQGPAILPPTAPNQIKTLDTDDPLRQGEDFQLQVNHINKDVLDCNEVNLELLCLSCHKQKDLLTDKGVSVKSDEHGYQLALLRKIEEWSDDVEADS